MLTALFLGLTGSVAHCTGMCGGVALLLGRRGGAGHGRFLLIHLGRIASYGGLGVLAGALGQMVMPGAPGGHAHAAPLPGLATWQGGLALVTAVLAAYMALAMIGRVPSPELALVGLTRRWGQVMRRLAVGKGTQSFAEEAQSFAEGKGEDLSILRVSLRYLRGSLCSDLTAKNLRNLWISKLQQGVTSFGLGLLWGLLPCGLVLAALLLAAAAGSPLAGGLTMVAFGLGTWPVPVTIGLLGRTNAGWLQKIRGLPGLRYAAALVVLLFGVQMALRGLAVWGWVSHLHVGSVMLW